MVSEMSSTTQRGAAAAAVEARRTRAMLRREVRSSILCLQGVQCLLDCCNDARCNELAMLRTRWFSSRKSHRYVLQGSRKQACKVRVMLAACKTLARRTYPEFTR